MFVILSQVVWALACLAWTTSAQSDSSDDFGGLYLYMDADTAQKYYRKCVCASVRVSFHDIRLRSWLSVTNNTECVR